MSRSDRTLSRISTGLRRRSLGAVKVAAKTSVAVLRNTSSEQSDLRWDQISTELGRMKGLMMKMGQMASYIEGSLPPEAQPFLAKLQRQSEPLAYSVVESLIEVELGAPIARLFDDFEPEALAAASIGQVHRAVTDGKVVAVKVQYPEIKQAIQEDLQVAGKLARLGMLLMPGGGKDLIQEMRERFLEECDYVREANNLATFAPLIATVPGASIPKVIAKRSGATVLTMEFVEGLSFEDFKAQAGQAEKNRAAEILARFIWNSIFRYGIFNADPHPGNYLFQPNGDVTFLDFGCVKQFDQERMTLWKRFALSILDGDKTAFKQLSRDMGLVGRERNFQWDAHWELLQYLYRPFLEDDFEYTQSYVQEVYDIFKRNVDPRRARLPGDMLFTNRLQFGFNSILSQLGGQANWKHIFREAVEAELEQVVVVNGSSEPAD